jgi:PAS domain S-box-containing protein
MKDQFKTKQVLIQELASLKQRIKKLEQSESERKRNEEALRGTEENFRRSLDDSPLGIRIVTIDGETIYANRAILDIYSYEDLNTIPLKKRYTPESYAEYKIRREKRKRGDYVPSEYEISIIRKDGEVRNLQVYRKEILWDGERQFQVTYQDITERKRAEEKLREAHRRLDEIIEFLPDATCVIDADSKVIAWNRAVEQMTGVSKTEMIGKGEYEYALPFYGERRPVLIDLALLPDAEFEKRGYDIAGRSVDAIYGEVYVPNIYGGKGAYLHGAASRLRDAAGNIVGAIESIRDITDRKHAEEALNETNETLGAIIQSSPLAIISFDPEGNVTRWNPAAEKMFGWLESEVLGQLLPYISEDKRAEHLKLRERVLRGEGFTDVEARRRKKDGTPIDISVSTAPLRDSQGLVHGVMSVNVDITERKRAEGERRLLEERLQRAEKMQALGTLAGGVAHDLNNVLGVLVGYSELLLQNVTQDSPFQRHAMQIFKGGQRAAAIIQDLLTLTRRGVLVSEAVNLNSIITDFLQMPEFEAIKSHHSGVQFKTSLDAELLRIKGSSTHLNKTVMNLLSNAAEAISGSGEVLIRTENRYVDRPIHGYDTTQKGEYAVLTVSDTGSGISRADLGRIFEPFYTKKVMGRSGTGLGLAVVWGTVKDHDGYIDVQSTEGEGSIFTLYFPVTREDLTKAEQVVPQSTYMGRGEHILVVDDVEGQRLLASAMLEGLAYKVSTVASGEEALEFVKNNPVDLLILDMIMEPGIDGLETYQRILEIRKDQKTIIVSGFSETERVHVAQSLGAGAYIRKPYVMEKLGLVVKKELDRK